MGVPSDGAALRRVTLRAPVRDPLLARQRLERALGSLDWAPPGLPWRALLLVRRLVATGQRTPALGRSIAESLRAQAREARRPWVDGTAAGGGAVWFADDDELAACLLREWLRGRAQEPWWCRAALGDEPLSRWLARRVTGHGDRLVPVIAQLASIGLAAAWIARLDDATADAAVRAIARDHAAPAVASALDGATGRNATSPIHHPCMRASAVAATVHRVVTAVPELNTPPPTPAGARLMVVALVAARDPVLLRSDGFAQVVRDGRTAVSPRSAASLVETGRGRVDLVDEEPGTDQSAELAPRPCGPPSKLRGADASAIDSIPRGAPTALRQPTRDLSARVSDAIDDLANAPPSHHDAVMPPSSRPPVREPDAHLRERRRGQRTAPPTGHDMRDAGDTAPASSLHRAETAVASPRPRTLAALPDARPTATSFGGLFYLLNAAIGLGLYGDFTAPAQHGIALSPWRLLAIAGDAWFGDEFARDALAPWLARMGGAEPPVARPRAWAVPDAALQPWGHPSVVRYRATARRLRLLHPAGFVLFDVPRSGAAPAAQAAALCRERVLLASASVCIDRHAPRPTGDRWQRWLLPLMQARLARALGVADDQAPIDQVCRSEARVSSRPTWVDVTFSLAALPLAIRLAGLDRDPGWIPAAGRDVRFHFE
ncbi:hypothetical protein [Scleromatobacter humisilvae]|uniref:Uncharacterized protein n=1 Tax=Scleromatobacter humisilvae TaxID=2897159 RepID=A0A9X1YPV8_9BURK|nr:hypothetical protein [Scleromatobacter humisilvae]MCK9688552.1 hypothetical protein [Scleromatobacter humisilvae]